MYASLGSKWGTSPNLSLLLVCLCFMRRFVGDEDPFRPHGGRQMLMNNGPLILRSEVYHGSRERSGARRDLVGDEGETVVLHRFRPLDG